MILFNVIFAFVLILLFDFREGSLNAHRNTFDEAKRKRLSNEWHSLGFIIRYGIPVLFIVPLWGDWKLIIMLGFIYWCFAYILWDGWSGLRMGQSFLFTGITAETDKFLNKHSIPIKIGLLVATIISIILYIVL